jgi:hypothetical protein
MRLKRYKQLVWEKWKAAVVVHLKVIALETEEDHDKPQNSRLSLQFLMCYCIKHVRLLGLKDITKAELVKRSRLILMATIRSNDGILWQHMLILMPQTKLVCSNIMTQCASHKIQTISTCNEIKCSTSLVHAICTVTCCYSRHIRTVHLTVIPFGIGAIKSPSLQESRSVISSFVCVLRHPFLQSAIRLAHFVLNAWLRRTIWLHCLAGYCIPRIPPLSGKLLFL